MNVECLSTHLNLTTFTVKCHMLIKKKLNLGLYLSVQVAYGEYSSIHVTY